MTPQGTTDHLILLSLGEGGRLTSACATRTLRDLHATEADLRRFLGRRRPHPPPRPRGDAGRMNARDLFGPPALPPPVPRPPAPTPLPLVSATATGTLRMDGRGRVVEVDVHVGGLAFTALTRCGRLALPMYRGDEAVRFTDSVLRLEVLRAVLEAASDAERRGWLR